MHGCGLHGRRELGLLSGRNLLGLGGLLGGCVCVAHRLDAGPAAVLHVHGLAHVHRGPPGHHVLEPGPPHDPRAAGAVEQDSLQGPEQVVSGVDLVLEARDALYVNAQRDAAAQGLPEDALEVIAQQIRRRAQRKAWAS